jgi:hypothetical protein
LGTPPAAAQPGTPPATGFGPGRTETIPPPPGDVTPPNSAAPAPLPLPEGPAIGVPIPPVPPNSAQAQIEELRRRVDQLERKVQELERALAASQKK